MNLIDLGKAVARYAPMVGAVLPFPGASALGNLIGVAFGGSINNTEDLIKRIDTDPDAAIKLKQIETDYQSYIQFLAVEQLRLANEDRANARAREAEIKDTTPAFLAKVFTAGYMFLLLVVILLLKFSTVNSFEEKILEMMLIGLSNAMMLILAYYFGATNKG